MTSSAITVAVALRRAERRLQQEGVGPARVHAIALMGHVLGVDRAGVLARFADALEPPERRRFESLVARRAAREPLQYLVGRADFMDFQLHVEPGVFIPRPETEQLVQTALSAWSSERPLAIDCCTGSGAIAVALARARPDARVLAIDLSDEATAVARRNARDLGVDARVHVVRGDLLECLSPRAPSLRERLGIIVCNPPYARRGDVVQPEVRDHEPRLAWLAGPRGTEIYARLLPAAARILAPDRPLVLELGYDQSVTVPELLAADGRWRDVRVDEDFQEIGRVLTAYRADA